MQSRSSETVPPRLTGGRAAAIERILAVTGEEAQRVGPERLRMGEIAVRANVSRASLYRYFASKDDLIRAWTARELETIFTAAKLSAAGGESEDFTGRFAAEFASVLIRLREHPVFRALVAINNTQMMRSTLESGDALGHARQQIQDRINDAVHGGELDVGQFDAAVNGELVARLAISLIVTPETVGRLDSEEDVREFARRYVGPIAGGSGG